MLNFLPSIQHVKRDHNALPLPHKWTIKILHFFPVNLSKIVVNNSYEKLHNTFSEKLKKIKMLFVADVISTWVLGMT